jgi:hypothetical protein
MQKRSGVALFVVGIILIVRGHTMHPSAGGQITEAVTGSPTEKSMYLYMGGAVLAILPDSPDGEAGVRLATSVFADSAQRWRGEVARIILSLRREHHG